MRRQRGAPYPLPTGYGGGDGDGGEGDRASSRARGTATTAGGLPAPHEAGLDVPEPRDDPWDDRGGRMQR